MAIIKSDPIIELNTYRGKLLNCTPHKSTYPFNIENIILITIKIKIRYKEDNNVIRVFVFKL